MKMMISQRGCVELEVYHLRPLRTYSSPSDLMALAMFVASEDATSGSVIANAERVSPASSGVSQRCFCASVPKRKIVSILPVSGAEQLNTSGANRLRPMRSEE